MKKTLISLICILTILACTGTSVFAESTSGISTRANNIASVNTTFNIDGNGNARVYVSYEGYEGITTNAVITVKIQKRFLLVFWQDVDGGEWTDYASGEYYSTSHSVLVKSGTYRATVEYTIYGTGGAPDVITEELKAEY